MSITNHQSLESKTLTDSASNKLLLEHKLTAPTGFPVLITGKMESQRKEAACPCESWLSTQTLGPEASLSTLRSLWLFQSLGGGRLCDWGFDSSFT